MAYSGVTSKLTTLIGDRFSRLDDAFSLEVHDLADGFRVECEGELDIATQNLVLDAIDACLEDDPLSLHIDYTRLTFVSWAGMEILVHAWAGCERQAATLQVSVNRLSHRLVDLAGSPLLREILESADSTPSVEGTFRDGKLARRG